MSHYPCADCCSGSCVLGNDGFSGGDTTTPPNWTEIVGNWAISSGVLKPDTSTANQRIRFDSITLASPWSNYISARIRGGSGDELGLLLYEDANNYVLVIVKFGGGTSGRLTFTKVSGGSTEISFDATNECGTNEYDIPANGWVTLKLKVWQSDLCYGDGNVIFNVVLEVDDTAATHTLGIVGTEPGSSKGGLATGAAPSSSAEFDDFEVGLTSSPGGSCDPIVVCCLTEYADCLGRGTDGWAIVSGSWTDHLISDTCGTIALPSCDYVSTSSTSSRRMIDYEYLNDNLTASLGLGVPLDETNCPIEWPADETTWRLVFSDTGSDRWYIEVRSTASGDVQNSYYLLCTLEHNGTIEAWILYIVYGAPAGFVSTGAFPRISLTVDGCDVSFGLLGIGPGDAWYSLDGGTTPDGFAGWVNGFLICVEGLDLNRQGNIGIGTGDTVDVAGFHNFIVNCAEPFDCGDFPTTDVPDPDDPGDPTTCCDDLDALQTGDTAEATIGTLVPWLGAGCADPDCSTSDFFTAVNATFNVTCVEKTDDLIRFTGDLGVDNPCDTCDGLVIRGDLTVYLDLRVEIIIEKIAADTCIMKAWLRGKCVDCELYFESNTFGLNSVCLGLIAEYVSGDGNPGAYNCCYQGTGATITFDIP